MKQNKAISMTFMVRCLLLCNSELIDHFTELRKNGGKISEAPSHLLSKKVSVYRVIIIKLWPVIASSNCHKLAFDRDWYLEP